MKFFAIAAAAQLVSAHTTIFSVNVNGKDVGRGDFNNAGAKAYVRSLSNNDPVKDLTSSALACNTPGAPAPRIVNVRPGDKIDLVWHHNSADAGDDIIADSHRGPTSVWISPWKANAKGPVWVKIAEDGYNPSTKKWGVDNLIAAKGKQSFTFPSIAAGDYIVRGELLALHEGDRVGGAQFYPDCVQFRNRGNGAKTLPAGVAFPGAYKPEDAGIHFDIYKGDANNAKYKSPGPAVVNL